MIGKISGKAEDAGKSAVIVETGGGVGYIVTVSTTTKDTILAKESCTLFTYTSIRKETMDLFGFLEQEEYSTFLLLLSVSGVGPKKALAILETTPPSPLLAAIKNEDVETMVSFGMGKKQAQRIVLDLQRKIDAAEDVSHTPSDVIAALIALGYEKGEIAEMLKNTKLGDGNTEQQIQEALKAMRGGGAT